MRIHHLETIPSGRVAPAVENDFARGGVATLGVFDGVHLGHRRILDRVRELAIDVNGPSTVLTFAVHPVVTLKGLPPRLITSLPHRLRLFEQVGIDQCIVLPFDDEVRALSAVEFSTRIFVDLLHLRGLVVGPDAHIGRGREGDVAAIRAFCSAHSIHFETVEDLRIHGHRVSSTGIRAAISDGDLDRAREMLGREVSLWGRVIHGEKRGRTLGFATANLDLHHEIRPLAGVYAIKTEIDGKPVLGVCNIGVRPTFDIAGGTTVEVHLLDFDGDLYGRDLEIILVSRLRGEVRFESKEALIRQIEADVAAARQVLVGA